MINCWNHPQIQSHAQGLILKFSALRKVLYSMDLKCCDILLKFLSNSISKGLNLKFSWGKPSNPTYQQNSQGEVIKITSYMQGPHIYNLPWTPWILLAGLVIDKMFELFFLQKYLQCTQQTHMAGAIYLPAMFCCKSWQRVVHCSSKVLCLKVNGMLAQIDGICPRKFQYNT